MTTYAQVQGTTLILYPYLFSTLQSENPYTNYGNNYDVAYWFPMTQAAIDNDYTLEPVTILPEPAYDPNTKICTQNTTPVLVDGVWTLGWTISTMTPEQKIQYEKQIMAQNQQQATQLLIDTDWSSIPAVGDPQQSIPYLVNQSAFLSYRSQLREIAVNPPVTPVTTWPIIPREQWSS